MSEQRSHAVTRMKVCALCCGKAKIPVTKCIEEKIRLLAIENYRRENEGFAGGMCSACRANIYAVAKGDPKRKLKISDQIFVNRPNLRSSDNCDCGICRIGRQGRHQIQTQAKANYQPPTPKSKSETKARRSTKVCSECFAELYQCTGILSDSRIKILVKSLLSIEENSAFTSFELIWCGSPSLHLLRQNRKQQIGNHENKKKHLGEEVQTEAF